MPAVIFDMNGVIVNDESYHNQSWKEFCKRHNFNLTDTEFEIEVEGKRDADTFSYLFKRTLTPQEIEQCGNERDTIVEGLVKNKLQLMKGLRELLDSLHEKHFPLAIATSSRKRYMRFIVDTFYLAQDFTCIVTGDDVVNGKPDPEIYLKTAALLTISPHQCVVFEDSYAGIRAAKSAGMYVIAITTTLTRDELHSANRVIDTFEDISASDIEKILL